MIVYIFVAGMILGAALAMGILFFSQGRDSLWHFSTKQQHTMENAIGFRLSLGPKVVALGGGTGLSTLLKGLKAFTRNITAIVTVTDEGGSSGRLRVEWGVLPPGDIRNCLVALAEDDSALNRVLGFRFDRGDLRGHSLGNLIMLALTEIFGDFRVALEEMNKFFAIRGRVLPVTLEAISLQAALENGEHIDGELDVSANGHLIREIWLEPRDSVPLPETTEALAEADLIVLGPGSLFTSVIPNLLIGKIAHAVRQAKCPRVYVCNLMTQPGETEAMSILDHVQWIQKTLGILPDVVLVNETPIPPAIKNRYEREGAIPLCLSTQEEKELREIGCEIIKGNFIHIDQDQSLRHNSMRLAETLVRLEREWRNSLPCKN